MSVSYRRPLKLAYFSPLAPQPSGISEYSQDLLPYLASWAEVHLFVDGYTPTDERILWKFPVWNYREYPWRREAHQYDCTIYQLGNSPFHRYLYPFLSRFPGVLVLHDLVLHHLLAGMAVERGQLGLYLREMAYSYGLEGARIATAVLGGLRQPPFFEYPLCQRALDASLGVLVHSQYLETQVHALRPEARVGQVPMGIPLPPDPGPKDGLRRRLGLPEAAFILGSFGEATHHKRIPVVLRSFARLLSEGMDAFYVIVGNVAPELDVEGLASELGVWQRVRVTGYLPPESFNTYLHAVDVCVNLRYPTAGETSASALRSMAVGRATIISDVGANRELPGACCVKLPVDEQEEALLAKMLRLLARDGELRLKLGHAARRYIEMRHNVQQAARSYIAFIEELVWAPKVPSSFSFPKEDDFDKDYLGTVAARLRELGFERRDAPFFSSVGRALSDLGLDPGWSNVGKDPLS